MDGLITEDGDLVALGAKVVLTKLERKHGVYFAHVLQQEEFLDHSIPTNPSFASIHP